MCIIERDGKVVIIDQTAKIAVQEASLAEAEALTKKNAERMNVYLTRIAELESQIIHQTGASACRIEERDRLQKQIAALQEIAVRLVATSEYETENWSMRMIPWEEISVEWVEHYKNKARRQLSEEHPEAFR